MLTVKSPDTTDASVGERIQSQRLLRRLSQTDLGNEVGVTFQQIQKYENGVNRVSSGRLQRIAEALKVPVAFFFEGVRGSSAEAENVNASLRFLESAAAVRIVRAFAEIDDGKVRQSIVALIEGIARRQRSRAKKR